ncbi:MAG TPA: Uma2 family endonuclease [Tepidisphaeraceae bacterium]|jgi:Uma2 family endonuclease|nr:Uma2 family endonuclease [Tepidisphaeraceae bacterium]
MTVAVQSPAFRPPRQFKNAAEWLAELGNVPLDRIIFDPWPGTATEADLLRFVERDKRLCELIDGTLVEKPVGYWEGIIAINLATILANFVNPRRLGAVSGPDSTMRMQSGRVRLPDVAFVSNDRLPKTRAAIPSLGPDLAVEILSEGNTPGEMEKKLAEYFQSGTLLAWIVDPGSRTVTVYLQPGTPSATLGEDDRLGGGDVLPGLEFPIADMFLNVPRFE